MHSEAFYVHPRDWKALKDWWYLPKKYSASNAVEIFLVFPKDFSCSFPQVDCAEDLHSMYNKHPCAPTKDTRVSVGKLIMITHWPEARMMFFQNICALIISF